ncbi:hypothetical protein FSP39_002073 [Pinctada imbricata]|uniref:Uncharacterized protein n=1 Tax=Pinctada imbricata TaxID=66713 RepID=A0AA89C8U7_PINIB|nr:hypothetical protein FSP39_002073 [Pinctada imbricata]
MSSFAFITSICILSTVLVEGKRHYKTKDVPIKDTVQKLFDKIRGMQATRDTVAIPPLQWAKFRGVYESDVRLYFHGGPVESAMRYSFGVPDNNMFATAWVTSCLLEAYHYGNAPKPSEDQIMMSLEYMHKNYHNKNLNYTNSIMAFWPQLYDEGYQTYVSTPVNLLAMFNSTYLIDWDTVYQELDKAGLKEIASTIQRLLERREGYARVFHIPPDFDDTSVNLGLGSLLKDLITEFPQSSVLWQSKNSNLSSVFNALKHYAYKPIGGDRRVNTIDGRTYFYMRKFLENASIENKSVALVTTWIQDIEDLKTEYPEGIITPGNINNVDITVSANALFGITNAILTGLVTSEVLEDPEVQQIYMNTSTMIAFQIHTNFSGRPDLALTYYPSVMEFYWFVSRTYSQLKRHDRATGLPHEVMYSVMATLEDALHTTMTDAVVKQAIYNGTDVAYYDDFMGDGDVDQNNDTIRFGEDRLYTTGMAINALITTWTYYDDNTGHLHWHSDTPEVVKKTVSAAVLFLNQHILSGEYEPWNAFFSGSVKGFGTSSSEYPYNRYEYFNGTKVPDKHTGYSRERYRGMEGVVNETWYQEELKAKHSPIDFHGFNKNPEFFPFWCSETYTYVISMLALSTFDNIM